jgi:Tol biopolymer transport system component
MALATGTHLGSYEVLAPIGAGGMGEVYQAHDTKLGRDVAIKVLPEAFAHDPERLSRFQREAKMLAALNHSNIATIYGLEQSNGTSYLVMELVSGETLADRVKREGAVPVEEALKIAIQIAEALEAAHEKGIIHRDLKPANVKVTPEGKVKVLDFGLAKAFAGEAASSDPAESPTLSAAATMRGVILGTAAYMSPEQARGKTVTKATDIWAFGCVLYELLCGRSAFEGDDITEILASVVKTEPDSSLLPKSVPPNIRVLLRRCLRKDRRQRLQDATDVRIEIEEALSAPETPALEVHAIRKAMISRLAPALGLGVLIGAIIAGVGVRYFKPTVPSSEITRVIVGVAPADLLAPSFPGNPRPTRADMVLSPDGRYLVFSATRGGKQQLYLRAMDQLEATPMGGTEGTNSPFFSPDGRWVGFWQGVVRGSAIGEIKKVPLGGGPAVTLCKTPLLYGASWGSGDTIVFANRLGGLWRVSAAGGTPQPVTTLDAKKEEYSHRLPQVLPDGKSVLFTIERAQYRWDDAQIVVQSLATGVRKVLIEGAADARYVPTGHLVYARQGTLMAVPFNLARLEVTGGPVGIIDGIMQDVNTFSGTGDTGTAQFSVSETAGALVYLPGGIADVETSLVWMDRNGAVEPVPVSPRRVLEPRLSPDGKLAAFSELEADRRNVWVYDISRGTLSRLTTEAQAWLSIWTPDGKRITFSQTTTGSDNLFWKLADGSGAAERLTTDGHIQYPSSWSPDGKTLAFIQRPTGTDYDIWMLSLEDGKAQSRPFLKTPFSERQAEFSPDGRWLAYVSDESGRAEVYVQPYPGPGVRHQVSTEGGEQPAWARSGRELFYTTPGTRDDTTKMMAVDVTLGATFTVGKPRILFEGPIANTVPVRSYDVTPDGRRFLVPQFKQQPAPALTEMILVQNWFEELKRRVPTGK